MRIHIRTDPFCKGIHIVMGITENNLCTVTAMLACLASRRTKPGPLFQFQWYLTRDRFVTHDRSFLTIAEVACKQYVGRLSFHWGCFNSYGKGHSRRNHKTLERWEGSAYLFDINLSGEQLPSIAKAISK